MVADALRMVPSVALPNLKTLELNHHPRFHGKPQCAKPVLVSILFYNAHIIFRNYVIYLYLKENISNRKDLK